MASLTTAVPSLANAVADAVADPEPEVSEVVPAPSTKETKAKEAYFRPAAPTGMGLDKYPSFAVDMHQKAAQMFLDDSLHDQRVRSYCAPSYTSGPNQERDNTEKLHRVAKSLAVFCRQHGLLNLVLSRQQCVQFLQSEAISENAAIGIIDWYFTNNDGLIAFDSLLIGFIVAGQGNLSLVAGAPISEHHSDSANLSESEIIALVEAAGNKISTKYEDGYVYVGQMKKGNQKFKRQGNYSENGQIRHGYGTYTHKSGTVIVGEFQDDTVRGYAFLSAVHEGKCMMKYVGLMKDSAPMGHGTQTNADGTIEYSGEWDNGRPINKEEPENVS